MEKVLDTINEEAQQKEKSFKRKIQLVSEENRILLSQCNAYKIYKDKFDILQSEKNEELE